jgi:AraC-like DNA-binding protein
MKSLMHDRPLSICLSHPPVIHAIGHGLHGPGRESFLVPDRLWWLHVYPYRATLDCGQGARVIEPGMVGFTPPGIRMHYAFPRASEHLYVHFAPVDGPADASLPALQQRGAIFDALWTDLEAAIGWQATHPARAQAQVWQALWRLAGPLDAASGDLLDRAREHIERHLAERIDVAELARICGCSHNHLTRSFKRQFGQTVVGYVRQRRTAAAKHLLLRTDRPLSAIAAEVGIPDPHLFNKTMRREFGLAPSRIRATRGTV